MNCDKFIIKLLETLKSKFESETDYSGKTIKLVIDDMIRRIE